MLGLYERAALAVQDDHRDPNRFELGRIKAMLRPMLQTDRSMNALLGTTLDIGPALKSPVSRVPLKLRFAIYPWSTTLPMSGVEYRVEMRVFAGSTAQHPHQAISRYTQVLKPAELR